MYYHKQQQAVQHSTSTLESYFYPLDRLRDWNRIYGRSGFTQYQLVVPTEAAKTALPQVLDECRKHGQHSFLTVLKLFGPANTQSPLSFPMEGYTLTLDLKLNQRTLKLCNAHAVVHHHAGRVYLAKDVRMSPQTLAAGYSGLDAVAAVRQQLSQHQNVASD